MTKEDVLSHEFIWGCEFGKSVSFFKRNDGVYECTWHRLIRFETKRLGWLDNDSRFALWWSSSDPPFLYRLIDYQQTWCFDPSEMPWASISEDRY